MGKSFLFESLLSFYEDVDVMWTKSYVDYVEITQWSAAEETLRLLRLAIYISGSKFKNIYFDMIGEIAEEEQVVYENGTILAFTEDIVFSSTKLINNYLETI